MINPRAQKNQSENKTKDNHFNPQSPQLSVGLKWSGLAHALLFMLVVFQNLLFPSTPILYVPTLRVDLVGLPDVLKKDLKTPTQMKAENQTKQDITKILKEAEQAAHKIKERESRKEPELKSPDHSMTIASKAKLEKEGSKKTVENKNKNALARIKALAKVQPTEEPSRSASPSTLKIIKGNRLSPGTSLSGEAKEGLAAEYFDLLKEHLLDNFTLPPWLSRQNFSAQVVLFIDSRGQIRRYNFVKLSGNPQFDDVIKKTLQESQPLPLPPQSFQASLITNGILVGFPL